VSVALSRLMVDAMDAVVAQVERDLTRIADAVAHSPAGRWRIWCLWTRGMKSGNVRG
jgi:hypothetical protein